MKYDFTSIIDRKGKDAIAVDGLDKKGGNAFAPDSPKAEFDVIPMWIADMNFKTCPTIPEAIIKRAEHAAYGYFPTSQEYYDSIIDWHKKRNGVTELKPENIGYENGVLGGIASAVAAFSAAGDAVLVNGPTYVGFTKILKNNGRKIITSSLVRDNEGVWRIDYDDMEEKIAKNHIHLAIFCNPHNPCGRVWERWELEKVLEIYKKYEVVVISDEIWSDLMIDGHKHIPLQLVNEDAKNRVIAYYAPSKTFNLAGLNGSYHIIYNKYLKDRIISQSSKSHYNDMNVLSMHALIGAYKPEGHEWVDELCEVLSGNVNYAVDYIRENFEGIEVAKPEGTYLLFPDCTDWCMANGKTIDDVIKAGWEVGVAWQDGRAFGGDYTIRMNLALPFERVKEAMERLKKYVFIK